jgi:hypothetical protein
LLEMRFDVFELNITKLASPSWLKEVHLVVLQKPGGIGVSSFEGHLIITLRTVRAWDFSRRPQRQSYLLA